MSNHPSFLAKKIVLMLLLSVTQLCVASEPESEVACEKLRNQIKTIAQPSTSERAAVLADLERLISQNQSCAKNLLGRLFYEGVFFDKNIDKAHEIFYDLTQQSYPVAAFNLAYLSLKEQRASPQEIMNLLHGLMIKYAGDRQWGYLSAASRDLAWDYLDELVSFAKLDTSTLATMREEHRNLAQETTTQLAELVKSRTSELREQSDFLVGVVMLGATASAIRQRGALFRRAAPPPQQTVIINSFSPRYYSIVPTGSPNFLYLVPH